MSRHLRIVLAAGEPSGDRLGAGLARELKRLVPDVELVGMGGDRMAAEGVEIVQHLRDVAVVGISEVLVHLPQLLKARRRMARQFSHPGADLFVPIDFPDFNFGLGKAAHAAGVPVAYFVSPQVWVWRRGRLRTMRRWIRRMLVLFPFEVEIYQQAGMDVRLVGHPLAETVRHPPPDELAIRVGVPSGVVRVALLPGSRQGEVRRLFPILCSTAEGLLATRPDLEFLVPVAPHLDVEELFEGVVPSAIRERFTFHHGDFPELLDLCRAGVVAAGTASLEAAIQGLPIVIVHRLSRMSYAIGSRLVQLEHVGLPNLIAGRELVPECIQDDCRGEIISAALGPLLDDGPRREEVLRDLAGLHRQLGGAGVFVRAAEAMLELLGERQEAARPFP